MNQKIESMRIRFLIEDREQVKLVEGKNFPHGLHEKFAKVSTFATIGMRFDNK